MKKLIPIAAALAASALAAAATLPSYTGPINDQAGILDNRAVEQLEAKVLAYRDASGHEIGVLIVPSLEGRGIEDYAHDVFRAWGIGKKGQDNGVLFLAAIEDKRARVEVGYGLEEALTDLEAGRLVSRNSPMAQQFRQGDYAGGVAAVVDGIIEAIGGEYAPPESDESPAAAIFPLLVMGLILIVALANAASRRGISGRRFGGPFLGGFGGGFGGGGGGGGGFSFGGGSSGGGGASGGW
ncbi:MAG TPA: TPM domain-containing protein [candidate division Zixibacteria bacterium]|nr:TPM domain-containing protein [candidate division Zixibacteria bacterium]MDD4916400.1 TPM domain-containing protein [candidate division Zixibacteria bacterium]MDM7974220.1 TPM domain-containing protein [candidate division Zixibacteria bacterium]HOD65675.1 TPM domain-containing protein [candidate division Zixibacteria bacterium]HOZ07540.1 TPM domain-containing protein [candidate division Zixibacteria bacterium]